MNLSSVRRMEHADLDIVLAWRNHPEVRRYMYTQHEITLDEHRLWFDRALLDRNKHLLIFEFAAQPLGFVNFNRLKNGVIADWGFYVAPEAPKGCGNQLGHSALDYAFAELKLHKVCGQALEYNERSIRFHQLLGFYREGMLRDQHFDSKRYYNVICFGLLDYEWRSTAKATRGHQC